MVGNRLSEVKLDVRRFSCDSHIRECSQSRGTLLANDKIKVAVFSDISTIKSVGRRGKLMEIEVTTWKIDVEHFEIIGNGQVDVEDGVSTGSEGDQVIWISWIYSHGLNSEGHGFIDQDISLRARSDFQFSSSHCKERKENVTKE